MERLTASKKFVALLEIGGFSTTALLNALRRSRDAICSFCYGQAAHRNVYCYVWQLRNNGAQVMTQETLTHELTNFLRSRPAAVLCRRYAADPFDALGELYLRLIPRTQQTICVPSAWVRANATGLLRNFLRCEYRPLQQVRENRP